MTKTTKQQQTRKHATESARRRQPKQSEQTTWGAHLKEMLESGNGDDFRFLNRCAQLKPGYARGIVYGAIRATENNRLEETPEEHFVCNVLSNYTHNILSVEQAIRFVEGFNRQFEAMAKSSREFIERYRESLPKEPRRSHPSKETK